MSPPLSTPVVFLVFNRPALTAQVFERIRQAKPRQLLIVADGPRVNRPGEAELCAQVRGIVEQVDWACDVQRNYADVNLGCKHRIASGLDWAFAAVEEAIILEDDCLPDPTFFQFCAEMLDRYRHDARVMGVGGANYQLGQRRGANRADSYYFSRFCHIWGWASWRRSWQLYDVEMRLWPEVKRLGWLNDIIMNDEIAAQWGRMFDRVQSGELDTWDCQWAFATWIHAKLGIVPNGNLISNIGYGAQATHTHTRGARLPLMANVPTTPMAFPLQHPDYVIRDKAADDFTDLVQKDTLSRLERLRLRLRRQAISKP